MKVGILTFHNAHNYGAALQAYALKYYICSLGHNAEIINYINPHIAINYVKKDKFNDVEKQLHWEEQWDRFNDFIGEELISDEKIVSKQMIEKMDIDVFICGSDQIWNSGLTGGMDDVYFLNFETKARKVSYAPSKFKAWIKEEEKERFTKYLNGFDHLSTREYSLSSELEKVTGRTIRTVVDPVFLLSKGQYYKLSSDIYGEGEFILVYYLAEDSRLEEYAKIIQKYLHLPIVEIHFYDVEKNDNIQLSNCGPREFIELFRKSRFVITNSFHGTAFSIIFEKDFVSIYKEDNRKDQLLKTMGLLSRKRYTDSIDKNDLSVDYRQVKEKKLAAISVAKNYLNEVLQI